jgi:hypothetical protein
MSCLTGFPVISPVPDLPGLTVATGFTGHGFGIGPAAGRLAADLATGAGRSSIPNRSTGHASRVCDMEFVKFKESLARDEPPSGLSLPLQALWWDAKGDWDRSPWLRAGTVQGREGAWVHAYLHRKARRCRQCSLLVWAGKSIGREGCAFRGRVGGHCARVAGI